MNSLKVERYTQPVTTVKYAPKHVTRNIYNPDNNLIK